MIMTKNEIVLIAALLERVLRTPALNLDDLEAEDREVIKRCRQSIDYLDRFYIKASAE